MLRSELLFAGEVSGTGTEIIMSTAPIGVFDSGIGGMTVVKELVSALPNEKIIYYGDTARVPYGNKSKETILKYSREISRFLTGKGVKAILVACNTVSAVALETLRGELDIPIIGVVKPGAKAAAEATRNGKIGVIATRATISSGIYEEFLRKTNPDVEVFVKACPLFVPLVEEGWTQDTITEQIIHRYIDELLEKGIDSLVLGCTHYPLLKESIAQVVGENVTLVNPALESAREFKYVLEENNLLNESEVKPQHEYYVSDGEERFSDFARRIIPDAFAVGGDIRIARFD